MHYGMIATGNHSYLDSLRDAPSSLNLRELSVIFFAEIQPFTPFIPLNSHTLREGQDPPLQQDCV